MDIPTIEITTPISKHKVLLKQFITGYDDEAIQEIYTSGKRVVRTDAKDPKNSKQEIEFEGSVVQLAEREGVRRVVVSVDGNTGEGAKDGVVGLVYNMQKRDADFVKAAVEKIVSPPEEATDKKK